MSKLHDVIEQGSDFSDWSKKEKVYEALQDGSEVAL